MKLSLVQLKAKHFDLSRDIEKARSTLESMNDERDTLEAGIFATGLADRNAAKSPKDFFETITSAEGARPTALPVKRKPGRPKGSAKPAREPEPVEPALANGQP